jgi:predicted transposase YdaD
VVSIIYYANKKPFCHSLNINDYFANTELAEKYAFTTQFIDLNRYSDEEILEHGFIAGYELILKAIREKNIDGKLGIAINQIEAYDHIARQVLIRYMSQYSDMETDAFYDRIIDSKPDLKGDVMTVAQQWQEQGELKGKQETARTMLADGLSVDMVGKYTSLDLDTVLKLKKEVDSKTQH